MYDHFIFYLLLFGCVFMGWLYVRLARYRREQIGLYLDPRLLPKWFFTRNQIGFWVRVVCLLGVWLLSSLSLITPTVSSPSSKVQSEVALDEIEFIIDVSRSMECTDTPSGGSRLSKAKEIALQIVRKLSGVNVKLRAFAGDSVTIVPPTEDYVYFQTALEELAVGDTPVSGTNFTALFDSLKKEQEKNPFLLKTLSILLTDGEDTTLLEENKEAQEQEMLTKIAALKQRFLVVALGTEKGALIPNFQYEGSPVTSSMHKSFLDACATRSKGLLFDDTSSSFIAMTDAILLDIALKEQPRKSLVSKEQDYHLFVLLALILLAIACVCPQVKQVLALVLFCCSTLPASVQDSVDQSLAFEKAGREDLAIQELTALLAKALPVNERDIVLYNMGTILAKEGRLTEALEYYRQIEARDSPLLFEHLAYNGALCSLNVANTLNDSNQITKYLDEAKEFASRSEETQKEFQEPIQKLEQKKKEVALQEQLETTPPKELIALFIAYLERVIKSIAQTKDFADFWSQNEAVFDIYAKQFTSDKVHKLTNQIQVLAKKRDSQGVMFGMQKLILLLQKEAELSSAQKTVSISQESFLQKTSIQRLKEMMQDDMSLKNEESEATHTEGRRPW